MTTTELERIETMGIAQKGKYTAWSAPPCWANVNGYTNVVDNENLDSNHLVVLQQLGLRTPEYGIDIACLRCAGNRCRTNVVHLAGNTKGAAANVRVAILLLHSLFTTSYVASLMLLWTKL